MLTLYYIENGVQKKERFDIPPEEFLSVENVLKEQGYKWYTYEPPERNYDPNQLTLDFGEIKK